MTNSLARSEMWRTLASAIIGVPRPHPVRVAIDGVDAAGKTTLADELATVVAGLGRPVVRASADHFLQPAAIRHRRGALSPDGYFLDSFDYAALIGGLLQPLGLGGTLTFRRATFDVRTEQPVDAPSERAEPHAILLLDGVFLHRDELRGWFDFSIFVRAGFDVTVPRAEVRDVASMGGVDAVRQRYAARYVPGQQLYLSSVQPERLASIVVDNNDCARPFIVAPRSTPSRADAYIVRRAESQDIARLPEIERRAARLFEGWEAHTGLAPEMLTEASTVDALDAARRSGHLWVAATADGEPVGFAQLAIVDAVAHLHEVDVVPDHGGRGVGSRLLEAICNWARDAGYPKVTLSTFRDVPWNRPFYASRGFRVVDPHDLLPEHVERVAAEAARGLRTDLRVVMERVVGPAGSGR